ncbi:hypothetical protein AAHC03_01890 [Spirometra sp. Aus1]
MYGLLLQGLYDYVHQQFEDDLWPRVALRANCEYSDFNEIRSYPEDLFPNCASAIAEETGVSLDDVMFDVGMFFVCFLLRSKYHKMLRVLGRNLGEFFDELDNLHRHMHFKFPQMVAPFFTCASEYETGLTLQYGSRRKGYVHYTRGIVTGITKVFDQSVDIEIVHQAESSAIFRLHYKGKTKSALDDRFRLPATVFFEIFPFCILLDRTLCIKTAGKGVLRVDSTLLKKKFSDCFVIYSPIIEFTWENEEAKTRELEAITQRAEEETKRAENLLYRMLPQKIAVGLRRGVRPVGMSEEFEKVTILFTDIVGFTVICSKLEPLEVVTMLSNMFAKFDDLTTKYGVYKVETIGDAYMIASGCPEPTKLHAAFVAEVSFALKETTEQIPNPTVTLPESLKIRIGIHSGPVMAGVVGLKMPRYCLFGETVTIANTLETNGGPNRINLSETTYKELVGFNAYIFTPHDEVKTPSKETLKTYWLDDRCPEDSAPRAELLQKLAAERVVLADCNLTHNLESDTDGWEGLLTAQASSAFSQSRRSSNALSGMSL